MHWIKKHILRQLSTHVGQRYTELKPESVGGNLFMYHMQNLQNSGYVSKEGRMYKLSESGKIYASRMSLQKGSPLMQPKIVVMFACQNGDGNYLLFRWRRQPYYGHVSFPFSKLHFGRSLQDTLQEALFYKTQLSGKFHYLGDVYVRTLDDGATVEHILAHIYKVTDISGSLGAYDGLTGEPFWGRVEEVPHDERVAGLTDIFKLVESGKQGFMEEITVSN